MNTNTLKYIKEIKLPILLVLIFFLPSPTKAQVVANAGSDVTACVGLSGIDSTIIGGLPSASGGEPPYTYEWSFQYEMSSNITVHASAILNDTTIANPLVVGGAGLFDIEYYPFYLKVTDANGLIAMDTVKIRLSYFTINLIQSLHSTNAGDSVFLNHECNVSGGVSPLSYEWLPNEGLSTNTLYTNFWAFPDSSISYHAIVIDSVGCEIEGPDYYLLVVSQLGVDEVSKEIKVYPNPATTIVQIESIYTIDSWKLRDAVGKEVKSSKLKIENTFSLDVSSLDAGLYFLEMELDGEKVVKQLMIE